MGFASAVVEKEARLVIPPEKKTMKPEILAAFGCHRDGEHAFTKAILLRNELNHLGRSTATKDGRHVSLSNGYEAEIQEVGKRSRLGWRVIATPKQAF